MVNTTVTLTARPHKEKLTFHLIKATNANYFCATETSAETVALVHSREAR